MHSAWLGKSVGCTAAGGLPLCGAHRLQRGIGRLGVVTAANKWRAEHMGDASFAPPCGIVLEHVGVHIALYGGVVAAWAHVLPNGHDMAPGGGKVVQHATDFFIGFTKPDHESTFGNGACRADAPEQF